jgi:hypothetical protein
MCPSSTNSFLQAAYNRFFAKNNVTPPSTEENKTGTDITNKLWGKQKWKMLKSMPGHNSENTWQSMSMLNKGLSPMAKSAVLGRIGGVASKLLSKPSVGAGIAAGGTATAGALAYGGHRIANSLDHASDKV